MKTQQRGGTVIGLIIGMIVGLAAALAVAVYVTKAVSYTHLTLPTSDLV